MDFLIAVLIVIGPFVVSIASNIVANELYDQAPSFARWLIGRAVMQISGDQRDRYREEWLAHLEECPGKLGGLWHALQIRLGIQQLLIEIADDPKVVELRRNQSRTAYCSTILVIFIMTTQAASLGLAIKLPIEKFVENPVEQWIELVTGIACIPFAILSFKWISLQKKLEKTSE